MLMSLIKYLLDLWPHSWSFLYGLSCTHVYLKVESYFLFLNVSILKILKVRARYFLKTVIWLKSLFLTDAHSLALKTSIEHLLCDRPWLGKRDGKGRQPLAFRILQSVGGGVDWGTEWQAREKLLSYWEKKAVEEGGVRNHGISQKNMPCRIFNQASWPGEGADGSGRFLPRSHSQAPSSLTSRGGNWDRRERGRAQPLKKMTQPMRTRINWLEPIRPKRVEDLTSSSPWASLYAHCNTLAY